MSRIDLGEELAGYGEPEPPRPARPGQPVPRPAPGGGHMIPLDELEAAGWQRDEHEYLAAMLAADAEFERRIEPAGPLVFDEAYRLQYGEAAGDA